MTTITQLTEIVNGSLVPSDKKLDGSLVQISTNVDNKLSLAGDGLFVSVPKVDLTPYYTSSQTDSAISAAIAQAQLSGGDTGVDLSSYATKAELAEYSKTSEISTLLGSFEIGMGEQLANKVNLSELSNYTTTEDVDTQIDEKFNNVYGPSLAANIQGIVTQVDAKLDKPVEIASETVTTPTTNSLPIYTLGNDGNYVLCTPDSWLKIGNLYVPAYTGTTIGKLD